MPTRSDVATQMPSSTGAMICPAPKLSVSRDSGRIRPRPKGRRATSGAPRGSGSRLGPLAVEDGDDAHRACRRRVREGHQSRIGEVNRAKDPERYQRARHAPLEEEEGRPRIGAKAIDARVRGEPNPA